ncbi:amidohydrolase family protein [Zeimonas arvi]|uniref:Amidohydrolase-related domain-containing protein n=1 Tax=Zeimonas arvi TaxID=2498847 RepID=A0A5C8P407_9BURK|nr:amidohydrolase family protein [Zeimonas arvi]TXL68199.1 hypothetical protein FHP08_00420 [Zeimonas arvi]
MTPSEVPAGACDSHVHLYGPLDRYPVAPQAAYAVPDATPEEFLSLQKAAGISRAVIVHAVASGRDNRRTLDALCEHPDRFRGVLTPPLALPTDQQLANWDRIGVRGIRFSYTGSAQPGMKIDLALVRRIAALGWHAQVHIEHDQILELEGLLSDLPGRVVIDHMARIPATGAVSSKSFAALLRLLDRGNVWVKLSAPMRLSAEPGPPYRDVGEMARALVDHAPERLVWGSDWPHVNFPGPIPRYIALLQLMEDWVPDVGLRKRILVDNACELYGFPVPG